MFTRDQNNRGGWQGVLNFAARGLWRMPGRFGIARILGPSYSLRCIAFHDVSFNESPFTKGMGVRVTPSDFEAALRFLTRYYTPVSLQDVLDARGLPPRPVLVTFDDGYASTYEWALPLCRRFKVPAVLFLNAAFLDNRGLAPDNLVCYAANVCGMEIINAAVRTLKRDDIAEMQSLAEVFSSLFPAISLAERQVFLDALSQSGGINGSQLAGQAGLYLSCQQACELAASGFEIGNHTYTHVHCRSLSSENFNQEIERNRAELGALLGTKVRSFSVPYGSAADLTNDLLRNLQLSGHEAIFLSESVANPRGTNPACFDRVSIHANKDDDFFCEIEILPRLRAIRDYLRRHWVRTDRSASHRLQPGGLTGEKECHPNA